MQVSWVAPPPQVFKINVDGTYRKNSRSAACGGLVRNLNGSLIKGFSCNLGFCNSVWAEMWALRLGIELARSLSLDKVCFELDSKAVVNMVHLRGSHNKFLQPLVQEILDLLDAPDWIVSVAHVFREANRCADHLANEGHARLFGWIAFDRASPSLALILREDAIGFSMPRIVA